MIHIILFIMEIGRAELCMDRKSINFISSQESNILLPSNIQFNSCPEIRCANMK